MQKMKKIFIIFLLLFPILLSNCSDPVSPDEVDARLTGEWYFIYNNNSPNPSPETTFTGIQINSDKTINSLGIETNTGKVAVIKYSSKKIIKANERELIWEYLLGGIGLSTISYNYGFENEKLILSNESGSLTYTKTKLGAQLIEPVTCNLSFEKDSIFYENEKISAYPSAYAGKISTSDFFLLNAEMDHAFLRIGINNFNGIGSYAIQYDKFEFGEFHSDVGIILVPDSLSKGEIIITQYDEVNRMCSGTFYFNAAFPDDPDSVATVFKEGIFTVPIYN